jgi:predicted AlkP superfamily phosphohydrolase/phosphomutase
MAEPSKKKVNRRTFLKRSAIAAAAGAAAVGAGSYWLGSISRVSRSAGKKVIVIGIDGMDPVLSATMMNEGRLPHLARLRAQGSFSKLGTSIPPQSPVAWANFINGAGPGSHGIFDFIHRHPHEHRERQRGPAFYSAAELVPGEGFWEIGDYNIQVDFWPVNHRPPATVLRRQGTPFWDYLDAAGVPSTFYDLPCNYPPSPSHHGHHRCISGMGTPDLLGTYGTYQYFTENGPAQTEDEPEETGKRSGLTFSSHTARARLLGPDNSMRRDGGPVTVEFLVHRDAQANAAVIEIQGRRIILRAGEWSRWIQVDFCLDTPPLVPGKHVSGICRFFLQAVAPTFKLYVSPINIDPSAPAVKISEPEPFIQDVSKRLGLFATTGFQEDYEARKSGVFSPEEFITQAGKVLEERLALFEYAVQNYDDGLLYFYFSSSDLQSHILWWDSDEPHPSRTAEDAERGFAHVRRLYQKLDAVIGDIADRYGSQATIIVMSDHGFANFGRQFCLNSWLRNNGYLDPECESIRRQVDWSQTFAYGLGINGLYLNLKGRESHGIVEPAEEKERLLTKLADELEAFTEADGRQVIRKVYRADQVYQGSATALAPDLIVGYCRGYRASWATCMGDLTLGPDGQPAVLSDNPKAWCADHCADALEVPGVLFSNRALRVPGRRRGPSLVDVAPSILAEYGLPTPATMVGKNIF